VLFSLPEPEMDDRRLEKVYDYTKWHIGIYLSTTGALTAGLGLLAEHPERMSLVAYPWLLVMAILFMFLAGICGAIVASSCTECRTYEELWSGKHGPFGWKLYPGRIWARFEHSFFWLSLLSLIILVFSSKVVHTWLFLSAAGRNGLV
jgi:hypothetical protein